MVKEVHIFYYLLYDLRIHITVVLYRHRKVEFACYVKPDEYYLKRNKRQIHQIMYMKLMVRTDLAQVICNVVSNSEDFLNRHTNLLSARVKE